MRQVRIGSANVAASEVLRSYWYVAAERQRVYHKRLLGDPGPWTDDPVISRFRFTNAYRAADRVSQDLIRIAYEGSQDPDDILFRILLFRFFNRTSTWDALRAEFEEIHWANFDLDSYDRVLSAMLGRGERIYSAAYIIPPPPFGARRKHRNHLLLIQHMMAAHLAERLQSLASLRAVFQSISSFPSLGPFLAYQLTIDLNYSSLMEFDENDFVVAGPGARSGIVKCFPGLTEITPEDVIRWMVDNQEAEFDRYSLVFRDLFGRSLTLIDCQNLFCETDKYARVQHPGARGIGDRNRIKQQFVPQSRPGTPFFPPKWGINGCVEMAMNAPASALA